MAVAALKLRMMKKLAAAKMSEAKRAWAGRLRPPPG
jgi:hypothetical protein